MGNNSSSNNIEICCSGDGRTVKMGINVWPLLLRTLSSLSNPYHCFCSSFWLLLLLVDYSYLYCTPGSRHQLEPRHCSFSDVTSEKLSAVPVLLEGVWDLGM